MRISTINKFKDSRKCLVQAWPSCITKSGPAKPSIPDRRLIVFVIGTAMALAVLPQPRSSPIRLFVF